MCDRIVVMNGGRLEQIGTPADIYDRPASPFVANFIGRANTLRAKIAGGILAVDGQPLPAPEALPAGAAEAMAVIRPHCIRLASEGPLKARVLRRVFVGSMIETELELEGGQRLIADIRPGDPDDALAHVGNTVALGWRGSDMRVFAT